MDKTQQPYGSFDTGTCVFDFCEKSLVLHKDTHCKRSLGMDFETSYLGREKVRKIHDNKRYDFYLEVYLFLRRTIAVQKIVSDRDYTT